MDNIFSASYPLNYEKRLEFKANGRPTPIFLFDGNRQCRLQQQYDAYSWLCGCPTRKALFCFPCLLFKLNQSAWSHEGVKDLKNLSNKVRKHVKSQMHVSASASFSILGRVRINEAINEGEKTLRIIHNREVSDNRQLLKHHIMAAVFLLTQTLPFRGHDESCTSNNRGNFVELLKLIAHFSNNNSFQNIMNDKSDSVFTGLSPDIQNDLIFSLYSLTLKKIKERVRDANFVSLTADETTDISNASQLAINIRVMDQGKIFEHFVDIIDVSEDKSAETLTRLIIDSLKTAIDLTPESECVLISQSYDGAPNMAGKYNSVQKYIRDKWSNAIFVHCYAHKWALVVRKACTGMKDVDLFFGFIDNLIGFFRSSPKRAQLISGSLPSSSVTRWLTRGKSVRSIHSKYDEIRASLESLECNVVFDSITRDEAKGLLHRLRNIHNVFFLNFFKDIFDLSDILTKRLQSSKLNPSEIEGKVKDYKVNIQRMRSDLKFHELYSAAQTQDPLISRHRRPNKRLHEDSGFSKEEAEEISLKTSLKLVMFEVIDTLDIELSSRFDDFSKFNWIKLFDPDNFSSLSNDSSKLFALLENLHQFYPGLVKDKDSLRAQLSVLYSDSDVNAALRSTTGNSDMYALLEALTSLGLDDALPEVYRTLTLALTYSLTSVPCERTFSVLRRLKTYTRSTMSQAKLKHTMLLSVESRLLKELSEIPSFCDDVIDIFAGLKERRMKLIYKK